MCDTQQRTRRNVTNNGINQPFVADRIQRLVETQLAARCLILNLNSCMFESILAYPLDTHTH